MLTLQKFGQFRLYAWVALAALSACSPSDDPSDKTGDLTVLQIEPDNGPKNTSVKIAGSGFGLVPADHTVTLNGKRCNVTDAFGELLTITIPPGAGSGKIKIELHGKEIFTPVFHYEYTTTSVVTIAGGDKGFKDANGTAAQFQTPTSVAVDTSGNIFVVDQGNHKIRKISKEGAVTTYAGSSRGYADGSLLNAAFNLPSAVAIDAAQNLYITDSYNDKIRKISPQGVVSTLAGSTTGYEDGSPDIAKFNIPYGIAVDEDGNVYVSDYLNCRIRKITPTGDVTTLAGKGLFQNNGGAFADGNGTEAYFYYPAGLSMGLDNTVYVADQFNHRVRSISATADVTTIGGSGPVGQFNNGYADGPSETSRFAYPTGACFNLRDSSVVVADTRNHRIRIIKDDNVTTLLGDYGYADGTSTEARFNEPCGLAVDRDGNIIVADSQNHRIRKIVFE
jgi:sugar lactone lactonase YvrE